MKLKSIKKSKAVINSYDWHKKIKERIKEEKQLVQEEENGRNQDEMIGLCPEDSTKAVSFTVVGILLIGLYYFTCGEGTEEIRSVPCILPSTISTIGNGVYIGLL